MTNIISQSKIEKRGYRITPVRKKLIELFSEKDKPLTAKEITTILKKDNLSVNKTTVYRELDFLLKESLIKEVRISPKITHYESSQSEHHHHLVCENCGDIEDFDFDEADLIKKVKNKEFKPIHHSIEFFGLCAACQ